MESSAAIETRGLTKRFGALVAVGNVSLSVEKGEIYGFLGLNGAGKTTAIRMLLGLATPTSGEAFLNGRRIRAGRQGPWDQVGYLVETPYAYPELSVYENLRVIARLRRLSDGVVAPAIERFSLGAYRNVKAKNLSLGNAQRLGLAKALMHEPAILILDEPTNGMDPVGIVEIREMLAALAREKGVTVFISSHILGEIAKLATRIGIIHEGRLIQELGAGELANLRLKRLVLAFHNREKGLSTLRQLGWEPRPGKGQTLEIWQESAVLHPDRIAVALVGADCPPTLLQVDEEDLESYFLRIIHQNQPSHA